MLTWPIEIAEQVVRRKERYLLSCSYRLTVRYGLPLAEAEDVGQESLLALWSMITSGKAPFRREPVGELEARLQEAIRKNHSKEVVRLESCKKINETLDLFEEARRTGNLEEQDARKEEAIEWAHEHVRADYIVSNVVRGFVRRTKHISQNYSLDDIDGLALSADCSPDQAIERRELHKTLDEIVRELKTTEIASLVATLFLKDADGRRHICDSVASIDPSNVDAVVNEYQSKKLSWESLRKRSQRAAAHIRTMATMLLVAALIAAISQFSKSYNAKRHDNQLLPCVVEKDFKHVRERSLELTSRQNFRVPCSSNLGEVRFASRQNFRALCSSGLRDVTLASRQNFQVPGSDEPGVAGALAELGTIGYSRNQHTQRTVQVSVLV